MVVVTFRVAVFVPPAVTLTKMLAAGGEEVVEFSKISEGPLGDTEELRVTVLATLPRLPRVIVEVWKEGLVMLREVGLAMIVKGTTLADTLVTRDNASGEPLTACTVIE